MLNTFTMQEDMWIADGPAFASGPVIGYRIGGMPDGRTARIHNFGAPARNDWRIMWIGARSQSPWSGNYESVEQALAAVRQSYE